MQISPTLILWAPIGLLFLTAIIGIIVERNRKDPCLKTYQGDFVVIRLKSGDFLWGVLRVYPSSLELIYSEPEPVGNGRSKKSYVLYSKKIAEIECIYRPAPPEDSPDRQRWNEEIDQLKGVGLFQSFKRSLRNFYGMLRDAFSQSVGLIVGMAKQSSKTMQDVSSSDKHATEVGQSLLKILPHAYEPVFERYRGSYVIVESVLGDSIQESLGVLDDYSVAYLLIRGVETEAGQLPEELADRNITLCDTILPRSAAIIRHMVS